MQINTIGMKKRFFASENRQILGYIAGLDEKSLKFVDI
jgi:hypothetical protein